MSAFNLPTLAVLLGLVLALPPIYGLAKPAAFREAARKFPRSLKWGYALTLLGTAWFLWNLSQESISDFASYKNVLFGVFAAIGVGTCIFVRDFLAVRGLAVVLLLLAKLMVDAGRPKLPDTASVLVVQSLAYVFVVAGIWLTVSPWRLRDVVDWATANESRMRFSCAAQLGLGLLVSTLGMVKF